MTDELKPCPFCGGKPEIETLGTCIEIDCCCNMSMQKCDHLTLDERNTKGAEVVPGFYAYSDEVEAKVLKTAIDRWNQRT